MIYIPLINCRWGAYNIYFENKPGGGGGGGGGGEGGGGGGRGGLIEAGAVNVMITVST